MNPGRFRLDAKARANWALRTCCGAATFIAPSEGRSRPHFTQDPDRIYLFHFQKGLLSIRWDGTDEKVRVKVTGNMRPGQKQPNPASVILMAPRGDQALAQVNSDLYVVTGSHGSGRSRKVELEEDTELDLVK